jgi:hypothetical protein
MTSWGIVMTARRGCLVRGADSERNDEDPRPAVRHQDDRVRDVG